MIVRPLLLWAASTLLLAVIAHQLAAGYPWGIDDGVKRLTARCFAESGCSSVVIPARMAASPAPDLFPLPDPFVTPNNSGFIAIFPVLWPGLGGLLVGVSGSAFGFHLLAAACYTGLLIFFYRFLRKIAQPATAVWGVTLLAATLLFYGLTFWEHALALLFLLPIMSTLARSDAKTAGWWWGGVGLGLAVYVRPETALLLLLFLLVRLPEGRLDGKSRLVLPAGLITAAIPVLLLERLLAGRWLPPQVTFNLSMNLEFATFGERLWSAFQLLFDAPLPFTAYLTVVLILLVAALTTRRLLLLVTGLPALSILGLIQGVSSDGAFTLTAATQGLFFSLPWAVVSLLRPARREIWRNMFLLGWGYLLLAFFLGPDQPGMHWGPRFLFPAVLPLLVASVVVMREIPDRWSRLIRGVTFIAAGLFAATAVQALSERGDASRQVGELIERQGNTLVVLDRWHQGADLEPLWGKFSLAWVQNPVQLEDLLLSRAEKGLREAFSWLQSETDYSTADLPIEVLSRDDLPAQAGWNGVLLNCRIASSRDVRWADLYWHQALRAAQKEQYGQALTQFEKALDIAPDNADIHCDYAICWGRVGDLENAVQELETALQLNPEHATAQALLEQLRTLR